jgi:RimJ/RimL family protein N-acetyltransferase
MEDGILELGFHLRPAFWGQGLAPEAARGIIDYAFTEVGVKALFAGHHPLNEASRRVLLKVGFVYTGMELYPPSGMVEPTYLLDRAAWSRAASN